MPKFVLLYNRLTSQGVGPEIPPAFVIGDTAKSALTETFGYYFRRVYGESAKSPDVVVVEGTVNSDGTILRPKRAGRMFFIAVSKRGTKRVTDNESSQKKSRDVKTGRFTKKREN